MEERRPKPVHARVVRIQPCVVVDVDARENSPRAHLVDHRGQQVAQWMMLGGGARPHAVVVRLVLEPPQIVSGCRDVADEKRQRARQRSASVALQYLLHGLEPGVLVSVQQYGDEERVGSRAGEMEQRRPP